MAAATAEPMIVSSAFEAFDHEDQAKDLLRFTTAGSVDDGKSTMIGRLLYDSRNVYEDQIESVSKASAGRNAGVIDFSLLTDGLRAEREQGITIDVAHRYFTTPKRKFIIADTPGHEQYTRNMVTGASTAELAIVLVDARKGVLVQSRRHAYIAALLGLQHLVVAVNKMDLVGYEQAVFTQIEKDFREFLKPFQGLEPFFLPISALEGDNVVHRSERMPWFDGPSLLEYLENVPLRRGVREEAFRFPVQRVVRPDHSFRGYAGTVAAGDVKVGDLVVALPSSKQTRVAEITTFDGNPQRAEAGQPVTLTLEDELDIGRGDVLVSPEELPSVTSSFEATLVWLNEQPADLTKRYRIKHNTRQDWAEIKQIDFRLNINTLGHESAETLEMNAVGVAQIETARPLIFDAYRVNRTTGSFILIDPVTNATVAAGLISRARQRFEKHAKLPAIAWQTAGDVLTLHAAGQQLTAAAGEISELDDPETAGPVEPAARAPWNFVSQRGAETLMPVVALDNQIDEARGVVKAALSRNEPACVTCSFQTEDMIVVELVREVLPDVPVLFLETGYHFPEVYKYRDEMTARYNLNLVNVTARESLAEHEAEFGLLYQQRPDECCKRRKVGPLFAALEDYAVWFTGLRRVQSPTRANLQAIDRFPLPSGKELVKVSPLATWSDQEVWKVARERGIPVLSLYDDGYTSIGCAPCTSKPTDESNLRSGRWAGRKLECGIHIAGAH